MHNYHPDGVLCLIYAKPNYEFCIMNYEFCILHYELRIALSVSINVMALSSICDVRCSIFDII